MNCPICDRETVVLAKDGVDRRRRCTCCGHKFTTEERLKADLRKQDQIIEDARALAEKLAA